MNPFKRIALRWMERKGGYRPSLVQEWAASSGVLILLEWGSGHRELRDATAMTAITLSEPELASLHLWLHGGPSPSTSPPVLGGRLPPRRSSANENGGKVIALRPRQAVPEAG